MDHAAHVFHTRLYTATTEIPEPQPISGQKRSETGGPAPRVTKIVYRSKMPKKITKNYITKKLWARLERNDSILLSFRAYMIIVSEYQHY